MARVSRMPAIPPLRDVFDKLERQGLAIIFLILLVAGPILTRPIGIVVGVLVQLLIPGLSQSPL